MSMIGRLALRRMGTYEGGDFFFPYFPAQHDTSREQSDEKRAGLNGWT